MPINAKPSPDWRLCEVRFTGGTLDGKPLTGFIELIPLQNAYLDDGVTPVSVLADRHGYTDDDSGVYNPISFEVVRELVTLQDRDGADVAIPLGVGSQNVPISDPYITPQFIGYMVVEHFREAEGRRYPIYPKYEDAALGIDLPTFAPVNDAVFPPPPPQVLPTEWLYDDGRDGTPIAAGDYGSSAVAGTPVLAATAAIHDGLGWRGGSITRPMPYRFAFTLSRYLRVPGTLPSGSSIFTIKNPNADDNPLDVRLRTGGTIDLKAEDGTVPDTSDRLWKAGEPMRWVLSGTWDPNTSVLSATVLGFFGLNFEGVDPDVTMAAAYVCSQPVNYGLNGPSGGVDSDTEQTWAEIVVPDPYGTPPPPQPLKAGTALWAGDATQTTVEVSAYTGSAAAGDLIGLAVSANADMSSATLLTAGVHSVTGWSKWSVTGLTAGAQYFHQLMVNGAPYGTVSRFRTLRPVGTPCGIKIAVGGCNQYTPVSSAAFLDIAAWAPDRVMHLGDFGYPDFLTADPASHQVSWADQCIDPSIRLIQDTACMDYIISDHDVNGTGASNLPNFNDPITAGNLVAWQAMVPARMEDSRYPRRARYRAEVEGRVRFVKLDTRSLDRTDNVTTSHDVTDTDQSMLGAVQLAWLKTQITAAAAAHQLIVLFTDPSWNGNGKTQQTPAPPPIDQSFSDKWPSYQYERDLISDYAAAAGAQMFIAASDSHGLLKDDGSHEKNGFAAIIAGPFHQNLHAHYQPSYQQTYPSNTKDQTGGITRNAMQYQRLTITDNGTTITVLAEGRECTPKIVGSTPTTVMTLTRTYTP